MSGTNEFGTVTHVTMLRGFIILECYALYEATPYAELYQNYTVYYISSNGGPICLVAL